MTEIRVSCKAAATVPLEKIKAFQGSLKSLSEENFEKLKGLILANGITSPVHVWDDGKSLWNLDGHQRVLVLGELKKAGHKIPAIPIVHVTAKDVKQAKRILLSNVAQFGHVESQGLYEFMSVAEIAFPELNEHFDIPGINLDSFNAEFFEEVIEEESSPEIRTLSDRFLVPPFSVLDTRQGYWQERKRQWLALGIKSELGRGGQQVASFKSQERLEQLAGTKNRS